MGNLTTRRAAVLVALLVALTVVGIPRAAASGPPCAPTMTVGTSIEAGAGDPWPAWPQRLDDRAGGDQVGDWSLGGGAYLAALNGDTIRKHIDAVIADCPAGVMYLGGPVNDLVSTGLDRLGNLLWAVHYADEAATAAGWTVLGGAILPFNAGAFPASWLPTLDERRQAYNSWAAAHFGTRLVDLSPVLRETTTQRGDARWYRDGLHLTRIGAALMAEAFPLALLED